MKLTTRGRYAVMAMVDLSKRGEVSSLVRLMDIADGQNLSMLYLEQLFMKLRQAGLVTAVKGPRGGYCLSRPATDISIADIMLAADENLRMTRCMDDGSQLCMGSQRCDTHDLWQALGDHIGGFFSVITLQHVLDGTWASALTEARLQASDNQRHRDVKPRSPPSQRFVARTDHARNESKPTKVGFRKSKNKCQ